jgi:hypothetical protein
MGYFNMDVRTVQYEKATDTVTVDSVVDFDWPGLCRPVPLPHEQGRRGPRPT